MPKNDMVKEKHLKKYIMDPESSTNQFGRQGN